MTVKQKNKIIYRLFFSLLTAVILSVLLGVYAEYVTNCIPEQIYVHKDDSTTVNLNVPVTATNSIQQINFREPVTFVASKSGEYQLHMKLFGLFDIRTVNVNVVDEQYVYAGGFQIGLYLKANGILAVSTENIKDYDGNICNPCQNIIQQGDYILAMNGQEISSKEDLMRMVEESNGEQIICTVRRNNQISDVSVQPVLDDSGGYKIGLWVKDDAQGIGTLTYITEDHRYGALGHGISDSETDSILDISQGQLYRTKIVSIVKGENGQPGEFVGTIDYAKSNLIGTIEQNTDQGIYGQIDEQLVKEYDMEQLELGYGYEAHKGPAVVRLYSGNHYKDYDVCITDTTASNHKNITFKVTSRELLDQTNGIVQGMSGCPIIQDGKIIGAVTHVFVDDSTCGYGIFVEKMIGG